MSGSPIALAGIAAMPGTKKAEPFELESNFGNVARWSIGLGEHRPQLPPSIAGRPGDLLRLLAKDSNQRGRQISSHVRRLLEDRPSVGAFSKSQHACVCRRPGAAKAE